MYFLSKTSFKIVLVAFLIHECKALFEFLSSNLAQIQDPIFEVSAYFKGSSPSEKIVGRQKLEEVLREERFPILYYTTDDGIEETLSRNIVEVASWINGFNSSSRTNNSNIYHRKLLVSFNYIDQNSSSVNEALIKEWGRMESSVASPEAIDAMQNSVLGIVINVNTPDESLCNIKWGVEMGDDFLVLVRNQVKKVLKKVYNSEEVEVGVGYTEQSILCGDLRSMINPADFVVLTIDLTAEVKLAESYSMFEDYINGVVERNQNFMIKLHRKGPAILRLNLNPNQDRFNDQFRSYQLLLRDFVSKWQRKNRGETLIFNMINEFRPKWMSPVGKIFTGHDKWRRSNQITKLPAFRGQKLPHWRCREKERLNKVASHFDTVDVQYRTWLEFFRWEEEFKNLSQIENRNLCKMSNGHSLELRTPPNILISSSGWFASGAEVVIASLGNHTKIGGMTVRGVIVECDTFSMSELNLSLNYTLGCHISADKSRPFRTQGILPVLRKELKKSVVDAMGILIWSTYLDLNEAVWNDFRYSYYTSDVQTQLNKIYERIEEFHRLKPGTEVILEIATYNARIQREFQRNHLFCNNIARKVHILFEALANWARIHGIRIVFKSALDDHLSTGWWSRLLVDTPWESILGYEVFVSRNYPSSMSFGEDPCIPWFTRLTETVDLRGHDELGVTLNMALRKGLASLSVEDLKVMMTFAFHVSPKVEIVLRGDTQGQVMSDVNTLKELLQNRRFSEVLSLNKINERKLFINIPSLKSGVILEKLEGLLEMNDNSNSTLLKIEGIHVSLSNLKHSHIAKDILHFLRERLAQLGSIVKLGVSFDNCHELVGSLNFPSSFDWIGNLSYVVCEFLSMSETVNVTKHSPSKFKHRLDALLDSHLLMKRSFLELFPKLESVKFRERYVANLDPGAGGIANATEEFLTHISHLSNYARAYNISFFISGFDNEHPSSHRNYIGDQIQGSELGWWGNMSYSLLSNSAVYTEKHAKHFKLEQWMPVFLEQEKPASEPRSHFWVIYLISGIAVAVLTCLLFAVLRLRRKVHILTKKEVREFYKGGKNDSDNNSSHTHLLLKFASSFEIRKSDFNLGEDCPILGRGTFGIVYKASVKGTLSAVKMPHDTCPKESFRSMLIEAKVLAHLGTHVNLVKLVGCYTKDIENGIIYIATELCENGSLQDHLRKDLGKNDPSLVRLDELIRFCMEIANGMEYISSQKVVHGDLSTRNVLLDGDLTCKIGDFGLSRKLYEYAKYVKENQEPLPWRWMSYETLAKMEFTTKSDVWSYGVTLWEIFSLGALPYPGLSWSTDFTDKLRQGFRLTSPQFATEEIFQQMSHCWELDSESRPSFNELKMGFVRLRDEMFYSNV